MTHALPTIGIRTHLGLGDMLVCNAIFRHWARTHNVVIPCKHHNVTSVKHMLSDVPNIEVVGVVDDHEASTMKFQKVLNLGMFGIPPFNHELWDSEMYRQANVPFEERWSNFKFPVPQPSEKLGDFIFVHDDKERGMEIDASKLPTGKRIVRPDFKAHPNIFDYVSIIGQASEIHVFDSCFAILADSIATKGKLVLHWYARYHLPPHYRKNWEIIN